MRFNVEYTDTFGGEANYCWVQRAIVDMPELTHYGYDGSSNYCAASKVYDRELMRKAKKAVGLTGVRGERADSGGTLEFRPYRSATVMFVSPYDA